PSSSSCKSSTKSPDEPHPLSSTAKLCPNHESAAATVSNQAVAAIRDSVDERRSRREPIPSRRLLGHAATVRRHRRSAAPSHHRRS
ncbi:unnamed protein product, partial [Thlaspi arvense]